MAFLEINFLSRHFLIYYFVAIILFIFLQIFSSTQAMAALSYTHLDAGNGTGSSTTFTTNSISVTANELVIIISTGLHSANNTSFSVSSVVYNGTSTSLTNIGIQQFNRMAGMNKFPFSLSAYYFIPSGSSSGTITVTFNDTVADYAWSTFYFTGESATTPIVQSTTIDSCNGAISCTGLTASLGSSITSNDATVAAFSTFNGAITATSGYTTIDNIATNQEQLTEYEITGTQSPSATWAATDGGGLAFEVGLLSSSPSSIGVHIGGGAHIANATLR